MTSTPDKTYNGLPICDKCGWPMAGPFEEQRHRGACPYITEGKSAAALAARVAALPSTKCGYGTGQLAFELDENLHVQLQCNKDGSFTLRDLWMLDAMTSDEAADLVRVIAQWRSNCKSVRQP